MRLYPKVIPIISREMVQRLMQDGDIEVETMRIADAEMDLSAIMREYLADEERVNQATREALERRGYDYASSIRSSARWPTSAASRWATKASSTCINQMLEFLLISRNVEEVFAADNVMRRRSSGR